MTGGISVTIITLNEGSVIGRCLKSVQWADEVVVVDSGSTDQTCRLATAAGATVYRHDWLGFPRQKNLAASLASNDWILSVDADEIVSPRLGQALRRLTERRMPNPRDGYAVKRRNDFLGELLPHTARSSRRMVRLYNRRFSAWDESVEVHERLRVPGRLHVLPGTIVHWNDFSLDELIVLYHRYAREEAQQLDREGCRAHVAAVVYRPVLRFGWHYIVRGEARVGAAGLVHSALQGTREFMRYALLWELQRHPEFASREPARRSQHGPGQDASALAAPLLESQTTDCAPARPTART